MATVGGMIANNASGANSCKLGTTQHQVLDLHVVLADGTSLWTSEIDSDKQPWKKILELIRFKSGGDRSGFPLRAQELLGLQRAGYFATARKRAFRSTGPASSPTPKGPWASSRRPSCGPCRWPRQKATCIVYFTDLKEACSAIPAIYDLAPSCFDTAVTTNLDLIRKTYPDSGHPEGRKGDVPDRVRRRRRQAGPARPGQKDRQGRYLMEKQAAADLIQSQVEALKELLERNIPSPPSVSTWRPIRPSRTPSGWEGEAPCRSSTPMIRGKGL